MEWQANALDQRFRGLGRRFKPLRRRRPSGFGTMIPYCRTS
ncbi:MAG: hypothetical protein ABIT61_05570 [Steroidobacteraceae bacterium]